MYHSFSMPDRTFIHSRALKGLPRVATSRFNSDQTSCGFVACCLKSPTIVVSDTTPNDAVDEVPITLYAVDDIFSLSQLSVLHPAVPRS